MSTGRIAILIAVFGVGILASVFLGPGLLLAASVSYYGWIISSTPDHVFEEKFAEIPEVAAFIARYSDHEAWHRSDIIAWKIITYHPPAGDALRLDVKKSMAHGGERISGACHKDGLRAITYDIPREHVMLYLDYDLCSGNPGDVRAMLGAYDAIQHGPQDPSMRGLEITRAGDGAHGILVKFGQAAPEDQVARIMQELRERFPAVLFHAGTAKAP